MRLSSLIGVRRRADQWLRWSAHPPAVLYVGITAAPCFCSRHSEVAVRFWPFCIVLFIISPSCACALKAWSLSGVLSCCRGVGCPDASTCVKGPRSCGPGHITTQPHKVHEEPQHLSDSWEAQDSSLSQPRVKSIQNQESHVAAFAA